MHAARDNMVQNRVSVQITDLQHLAISLSHDISMMLWQYSVHARYLATKVLI